VPIACQPPAQEESDRQTGDRLGQNVVCEKNPDRVTNDFPRLVPASIVGCMPVGLGAVNYELRLDAAASWMVASSSSTAVKLLQDFASSP